MSGRRSKGTSYKDEPGYRANRKSAGLSPPLGLTGKWWSAYRGLEQERVCAEGCLKGPDLGSRGTASPSQPLTSLFSLLPSPTDSLSKPHSKPEARNALMWSVKASFPGGMD